MNRDLLEVRTRQLLAAARAELPSEEARRRISAAVRDPAHVAIRARALSTGANLRLPVVLAAAVLLGLLLLFVLAPAEPLQISAERLPDAREREPADAGASEDLVSRPAARKPSAASPESPAPAKTPPRTAQPPPPSLEEELAAVARVRAALDRGQGAQALAELDRFATSRGFRKLAVEASLLRIEALDRAGKADESQAEARRFVQDNPHSPLVDRAGKFTQPNAPQGVSPALKSESE